MKYPEPTYRYFVQKNGEWVNIDDLTQEERTKVGVWAYQTILKSLGYRPVQKDSNHVNKADQS